MDPRRPVRLVDVAVRAGVTASTASRALWRPELVREETRARVRAAADELGYVPNRAARGLITGRYSAIALVVPDLANEYFAVVCRAAQEVARERGYEVFMADTGHDPRRERQVLESVARWSAGVIIAVATRGYRPEAFGVPMVYLNRRVRGSHAVLLDPYRTVETQIHHLVGLGHEHIAWTTGAKHYWTSARRLRRAQRFGITYDVRIVDGFPVSVEGGLAVVDHLDPDVTALACFSDRQALGALRRAQELGYRVPEDLSIMGSDDVPYAAYVFPGLTTVHAPKEALGRAAVSLLLDHLDHEGPVIEETLHGHLVVRGSTGPPRSGPLPAPRPACSPGAGR